MTENNKIKKIYLMFPDEVNGGFKKREFETPEFIPADVTEDAMVMSQTMETISSKSKDPQEIKRTLMEVYAFIANRIFNGQFTAEQYRSGMDARYIIAKSGQLIKSVIMGVDAAYGDAQKK